MNLAENKCEYSETRDSPKRDSAFITSLQWTNQSPQFLKETSVRRTTYIHGLPVGGCDVRNSSNSFALRWRVFSSEMEKLKWFCFDLVLKLALYTLNKKKTKKK